MQDVSSVVGSSFSSSDAPVTGQGSQVSAVKVLGVDPHGRRMALLWALPALTFMLFPALYAYHHRGSWLGVCLFVLTFFLVVSYLSVWLVNPTPVHDSAANKRFIVSHVLLLACSFAVVAVSFALGNDGTMLHMFAYSFAAWVMQAPKRVMLPGLLLGLAVYGVVYWLCTSSQFFPVAVFMAVTMTFLSRMSINAGLRQEAQQRQLLSIARDQERLRIGADLHDILGHSLTAIVVKAQLAERLLLSQRADEAHSHMQDLLALSRQALGEVRTVVSNMRLLDLNEELAQVTALLESAGIHVSCDVEAFPPPGLSTSFFARVLREGTTNILAHSQARNVHVVVSSRSIVISNDGFSPRVAQGSRGAGTGLLGLRDVMSSLGTLSWGGQGSVWVLRADLCSENDLPAAEIGLEH